jgi:aminopeptidase N/puromycin-sensitive aminopeptidase
VDVAKYVLHYYNNYFGIPYPLKKLDLIALPDLEAIDRNFVPYL